MIPKSYHTSGTQRLKRAVKVLGSRTIDQRTKVGKALAAYREDLFADLGGAENLSRQEHLLVEEVIITMLLLSTVGLKRRARELPALGDYLKTRSDDERHPQS